MNTAYKCPHCNKIRFSPFPKSDESGDVYCPDCNWTLEDSYGIEYK